MKAVRRADAVSQAAERGATAGRAGPGRTGSAGPAARAPRRVRALAGAGAVLAAAGALAGCSTLSPATINTPYAAADGVNVDLGDVVALRDVLVVATEKGGRGSVVGTVVNRTNRTVTVELAAQLGENSPFGQTRINVPPNGSVLIAPDGVGTAEMLVDDIPVGPGEVIEMSAASPDAGTTFFKAPVLPATGQYSSLTAPPTTAPPTPSETATGEPSESATGEPSEEATSTDEPTEEPTETP